MSGVRDLFSVASKVVVVSGGSRGIGKAIAAAFSESGANVVACARSEADLKGAGLPYVVCDVTDAAQVRRSVDRVVEQFGRIDVLFNAAGVNYRHAAASFPEEEFDKILAINARGSFLMAKACGAVMIGQGGGKIVNIASLHTHQSLPGVCAYGMSKGAIGSMTRALAVEWAPRKVQVNAIAPGFIVTDLNATLWEDRSIRGWAEGRTPAGRLGVPGDLIGTALFLAASASDFMTGQVLYVDGGFTAGSEWPLRVPE